MNYIEIKIKSNSELTDMLIAEIAEIKFDNFVYTEEGFDAYCEEGDFNESDLNFIINKYKPQGEIVFSKNILEKKNWNEEWEKSFDPVIIEGKCIVRASFHAPSNLPYEIIIDPKMSFGTGHHATTSLMLEHQLMTDHNKKKVLDVGCGTAVLAIMAQKQAMLKHLISTSGQ
jgi:ribosomal protein L11 methyltransferase